MLQVSTKKYTCTRQKQILKFTMTIFNRKINKESACITGYSNDYTFVSKLRKVANTHVMQEDENIDDIVMRFQNTHVETQCIEYKRYYPYRITKNLHSEKI
jgi:hypothetical protein